MIWRIMEVSRGGVVGGGGGMWRGEEGGKSKEAESNNCWIIDQSYAQRTAIRHMQNLLSLRQALLHFPRYRRVFFQHP